MKIISLLLTLAAILSAAGSSDLELGGYLETGLNIFAAEEEITSAKALFRLEGNYDISDKGKVETHILYHYDLQPLDPFSAFKKNSIYDKLFKTYYSELYSSLDFEERLIVDKLTEIYSSGYFDHISYSSFYPRDRVVMDRALVKMYFESTDITFGKQQIAWGTGYAYNPTDIWNIKDPLDPDAAKMGLLAVSFDHYFGTNSSLSIITAPGSDLDHWKYGVRIKSFAGRFGYSFSAVRDKTDDAEIFGIPEKIMLGADITGEIFEDIGIRGEAAVFNPRYAGMESSDTDSLYFQAVGGIDYTFDNGLYFLGEYYYNGRGESSYKNYDLNSFTLLTAGGMSGLAQNYITALISYDLFYDYTARLVNVTNLDDNSAVLIPELQYVFHDNIIIKFNSNIFLGSSERSEYGGLLNSFTLSLTGYF